MIKIDKNGLMVSGQGIELLNELANIFNAFMDKGILNSKELHTIIDIVCEKKQKNEEQQLASDLLTEAVNLFGEKQASEMFNKLFDKFGK